jgi:hypothetical protein
MSFSPDERTLDRLVAAKPSPLLGETPQRVATPHRASLGTTFLGVGASLVAAINAVYGFSWFVSQWEVYPDPVPALLAWILLIVVLVATFITARLTGDHLPTWIFVVFLAALAIVMILDIYAVWQLHDIGQYATAALSAVVSLLLVLTLRRSADLYIATGVAAGGLAIAMIVNTTPTEPHIAPQITALAFAVLPVIIGILIVRGFRRMMQVELDRVLIQSTVSAPRFAVGMLASEELARLDLAAEDLLDSVASGRTALPLRPKTASVAASLATELRLHLIEGRRETWLHHAITESDILGRSVTLDDKGGFAGLLDATQRDGLLAAIWLLVSDTKKATSSRTVRVELGPIVPRPGQPFGRLLPVPIRISTTGVPRNRVDPVTWDALRKVGTHVDSTQNASLKVEIECFVDNPAEI